MSEKPPNLKKSLLKMHGTSSNTPVSQPSQNLGLIALVKFLARRAAEADYQASKQKTKTKLH